MMMVAITMIMVVVVVVKMITMEERSTMVQPRTS